MMAKKGPREIITLESTASTGHRYTTMKNKKNTPDRLRIKKCERARARGLGVEFEAVDARGTHPFPPIPRRTWVLRRGLAIRYDPVIRKHVEYVEIKK